MPGSKLVEAAVKLIDHLLRLVSEDRELRSHVRAFAEHLLAATEQEVTERESLSSAVETQVEEAVSMAVVEPSPVDIAPPAATEDELPVAVAPPPSAPPPQQIVSVPGLMPVTDSDLPLIETRCRMKAEGSRWSLKRQQRIAEGADFQVEIEPFDREIIEKAKKLPDCFLWMNHSSGPSPSDPNLFDDLAGCFETTADAIALTRSLLGEIERDADEFELSLNLLAEAHAALRIAVDEVGYKHDSDQVRIYEWLRITTGAAHIYIPQYMRMADRANPKEWSELSDRIQALDTQVEDRQGRHKRYTSALKRARYHQKRLIDDDKGGADHDWEVFIDTIDNLVQDGTPPSSIDLRELLLPMVDRLPDSPLPKNVQRVIREIDRFLATRSGPVVAEEGVEATEDVKQVAEYLNGKVLVLIGGVPRPHAREALKCTFGLKEVDWIETREHDSFSRFEPNVARSDVAVVLLAIRWSSHDFGNVREFCIKHGKPIVRLPGGYNPNQVAAQIIKQCSGQF